MNNLYKRITCKIVREWDRARGLDFEMALTSEEAGLNPDESHNSTPSGNHFLKKVLDGCSITSDDRIIDLGCGKGSAMRLMRNYPFKQITGVELSERVASIGMRNFKKMGDTRCEVICMDAARFMDFKRYSYLYFYNPFPGQIMQRVMSNLLRSLRPQQDFTIVYCNPVCHEAIIKTGTFAQTGDFPADWGNRIYVYERAFGSHPQ